jgi:hypothetical protein
MCYNVSWLQPSSIKWNGHTALNTLSKDKLQLFSVSFWVWKWGVQPPACTVIMNAA